jgi:hypothetical protein
MSALQTDIISRLRPRTVGEIVDGAFRLYRRNFRSFLLIVAVVYLPVRLLSFGTDVFLLGKYGGPGILSRSLAAGNALNQISTFKTYFEDYLTYFAQWALTVVIVNVILDYPVSIGEAYGEVKRRLGSVVGLIGLQIIIALGVVVVPPIFLLVALGDQPERASGELILLGGFLNVVYAVLLVGLQLVVPAAVNEGLSPVEALSRSWELINRYWWRTVALVLVLSIIAVILALVTGTLLGAIVDIAFKSNNSTGLAIQRGIGILVTILYAPVEIGAVTLYYFDQRVRKEGFDLETAIAGRYEGDAAQDGWWDSVSGYGYTTGNGGPSSAPLALGMQASMSPGSDDEPLAAQGVRQDSDIPAWPSARQSGDAMSAVRHRAARDAEAHRNMHLEGAHPTKRKTDRHPNAYYDRDTGDGESDS